jgi:hypothetical protein
MSDAYTLEDTAELEWLGLVERTPDATVKTGIEDMSAASSIDIYYRKDDAGNITHTYTVTVGEFSNADPLAYPRYVSPEQVLADYMQEIKDA